MLGGGAVFLELAGDVFDGRQGAKDMNFFVGRVDVDLQFSFVRTDTHVLIMIDNFNEIGVRVFFQLLDDGVKNRQRFARVVVYVAQVFVWHQMHGHGHGRGRHPQVNVRTAGAEFIDVDANHAFTEGVGARAAVTKSEKTPA